MLTLLEALLLEEELLDATEEFEVLLLELPAGADVEEVLLLELLTGADVEDVLLLELPAGADEVLDAVTDTTTVDVLLEGVAELEAFTVDWMVLVTVEDTLAVAVAVTVTASIIKASSETRLSS